MSAPGTAIRANTILPAHREPVTLVTADGLRLVGELASPVDRPPVATLVTLHPLPTHGGYMDSHVLRKAAWRLPALAGMALLRFNTRGTSSAAGTSEGTFDQGRAERYDVEAAWAFALERDLPRPWLLGWSFGTDLALKYGRTLPGLQGVVLLSPPLRTTTPEELAAWADTRVPLVCLVPELDDYLRPDEARERFSVVPHARIVEVEGAKHLWVGEPSVRRVLDEIVAEAVPGGASIVPLPSTWAGPYDTHVETWQRVPAVTSAPAGESPPRA